MTSGVWTVDVDFVTSHDTLKAGRLSDGWHRVTALADTAEEAELVAAQIVSATQGMATRARVCL